MRYDGHGMLRPWNTTLPIDIDSERMSIGNVMRSEKIARIIWSIGTDVDSELMSSHVADRQPFRMIVDGHAMVVSNRRCASKAHGTNNDGHRVALAFVTWAANRHWFGIEVDRQANTTPTPNECRSPEDQTLPIDIDSKWMSTGSIVRRSFQMNADCCAGSRRGIWRFQADEEYCSSLIGWSMNPIVSCRSTDERWTISCDPWTVPLTSEVVSGQGSSSTGRINGRKYGHGSLQYDLLSMGWFLGVLISFIFGASFTVFSLPNGEENTNVKK